MKSPRDANFIDLAAYRRYGMPKPTPPVQYRIDWLKFFTWSLAICFSLSVWACLLLLALWWRA